MSIRPKTFAKLGRSPCPWSFLLEANIWRSYYFTSGWLRRSTSRFWNNHSFFFKKNLGLGWSEGRLSAWVWQRRLCAWGRHHPHGAGLYHRECQSRQCAGWTGGCCKQQQEMSKTEENGAVQLNKEIQSNFWLKRAFFPFNYLLHNAFITWPGLFII